MVVGSSYFNWFANCSIVMRMASVFPNLSFVRGGAFLFYILYKFIGGYSRVEFVFSNF